MAGESDPAIARRIGRSMKSVREKLDRLGIPGLRCNGQCHGLRLCVPTEVHEHLAAEAERRQVSPTRLAERVLTVVARDGLFRGILDL